MVSDWMRFSLRQKGHQFPCFPPGYKDNFQLYSAIGPHLHDYLKEMNQEIFRNMM
jgi:oligo-1,6-glucosidase